MAFTDRAAALAAAADAIRSAERITAICHQTPDADTIGGAAAVALVAQRLGKAAEIVSADRPAPMFDFLEGIADSRRAPELEPDLAVICDAATLERVGRIATDQADWFRRARVLNVDHHVSNDGFGDVNLVDPTAAATCQVLAELVAELGVPLDAPLATALLTGIVRDSQGFSDPSTSPRTLRLAAQLVEAGASIADIHRTVLMELPFPTMALWGRMLAGAGERAGGRIVYATLTQEMLDQTGTQQHDADGLAEFLARAKDARVTLLLREIGPSSTRVSVRTDGVDATGIASPF
ncbi:MAG TPA: DHH family phosphoesterase, partial [Candidatus Limnocylindria bacterium]|nr:DHH family phosphoesterase [Candidatus Limnocylindria bacterium]